MKKRPVTLIIMDGYGLDKDSDTNAVTLAKKPNLDYLFNNYPNITLEASGEAVGLPEGQMGNSEVGHLNIGAGRIVYQSLTRINVAIKSGEFKENSAINEAIELAIKNNKKLHVLGLCSDGGVHSHTSHIISIIKLAYEKGLNKVYYHAFLDGRDVAPKSATTYLKRIIDETNVKVGTVGGRYYGMDRDKNYDRVQIAYDTMTIGSGEYFSDPLVGIETSYENNITDEFVVPFVCSKDGMIEDGDSVIFANFRPDRAIQIATALSNPEGIVYNSDKPVLLNYSKGPNNIFLVSMMKYADSVKGPLAFELQTLDNLFGDVVSANGLKQLRIAETEKYAHVTFFFDGGTDREIKGATRILVNSPKVATYDLQPEMNALEVTDKVIEAIKSKEYDVIILNYANCDMVGHTGIISASIKAVETVDECVGRVIRTLEEVGGVALVTADHGNAEKLMSEDGKPFTAHTTNKVPLIVTDKSVTLRKCGILADLAPTMLEMLEVEIPKEFTANSLLIK